VSDVQVQLVFRTDEGDRFELRDVSAGLAGHDEGAPLGDGQVFALHGRTWRATRDGGPEAIRFVCTPVEATGD
jgi:hypothetical protein